MGKLLLSICLTSVLLAAPLPARCQSLFRDDFTVSWIMPRGGWQLVDGHFLNTATSGYANTAYPIFNGGPSYSNYSIQFDFCPTQFTPQQGAVIGVLANLSAPNIPMPQTGSVGYTIGFGYQDNYAITRTDGGGVSHTLVGGYDARMRMLLGHVYVVAVAAETGSLKFKVYEKGTVDPGWMYAATDSTYSSGYFGIYTFETLGWVDNVEVTAPPAKPAISDIPADQGGALRASWRRSSEESPTAANPVIGYDLQKYSSGWQTIATLAAAAADSYSAVVATDDVYSDGQPLHYSRYRVVHRTASPLVFYESLVDSAYSVDNLPPAAPQLDLYDGETFRTLAWTPDTSPDLRETCLYRDLTQNFVAGDPVICSAAQNFYMEDHLARYFYRARSYDIHGNGSAWSDEVTGRWPTPVLGVVPTALRLYPCQPNPFNPMTTIKYDLPDAGSVRLSVFDISGRLVRTLADGVMPLGSHEVIWDGRDESERKVASGSYLARLESGGKVEIMRMGLVK